MSFWEWYTIVDITGTLTLLAYLLLFHRPMLYRWADAVGEFLCPGWWR